MNIAVDPKEARLRLRICESCEHFEQELKRCKLCGCFMVIKTKLKFTECKVGYWNDPTRREQAQNDEDSRN